MLQIFGLLFGVLLSEIVGVSAHGGEKWLPPSNVGLTLEHLESGSTNFPTIHSTASFRGKEYEARRTLKSNVVTSRDGKISFSPKVLANSNDCILYTLQINTTIFDTIFVLFNFFFNCDIVNVVWVTVNVTDIYWPKQNDWIGVYSPTTKDDMLQMNTTRTLQHYPVKFQYLSSVNPNYEQTGSATLKFQLVNMRAPYYFVVVKGGNIFPLPVAFSSQLTFAYPNDPLQVRLARTKSGPTEMRVTWTSGEMKSPVVYYGILNSKEVIHSQYKMKVIPTMRTYTRQQMCDAPANSFGWRNPGFFYTAVMSKLIPGNKYWYSIGEDDETNLDANNRRRRFEFTAAPVASSNKIVRFVAFGDMGQAPTDDSGEHSFDNDNHGEIGSLQVTKRLKESFHVNTNKKLYDSSTPSRTPKYGPLISVNNNRLKKHSSSLDFVLHIGDIAYAVGYGFEWDAFHNQIEPICNHEADGPALNIPKGSPSWTNGPDSGGECGIPYKTRFFMPTKSANDYHGSVAIIMMSTEHAFGIGSSQRKDLEIMLAGINRDETPWVIFAGHRPIDFSGDISDAKILWSSIQPLLDKYKVDVAFWGHHHTYQSKNDMIPKKNDAKDMTTKTQGSKHGIVHYILGTAGFHLATNLAPVRPYYTVATDDIHFGYLEIEASPHSLQMDFINATDGTILDSHTIQGKSHTFATEL